MAFDRLHDLTAPGALRDLHHALPVGLVLLDRAALVLAANPAAARMMGVGLEELERARLGDELLEVLDATGRPLDRGEHPAMRALLAGEPVDDQLIGFVRDGEPTCWAQVSLRPVGEAAMVAVFLDVTTRYEAEHELRRAVLHDHVTGLASRRLFLDRLEHALTRTLRTGRKVGVLYVDLDGFKHVNDLGGHAAGDEVLRTIAGRLDAAVRPGDTVGRLGGDEFAVLCDEIDEEGLAIVVDRVTRRCSEPVDVGPKRFAVAASVGSALGDHRTASAQELVATADTAMYAAKREGRPPAPAAPEAPGAGEPATDGTILRALGSARDLLGVDLAYLTEDTGAEHVPRALASDGGRFGLELGMRIPHALTVCHAILDGRLPNPIRDFAELDPAVVPELCAAGGVRCYASVPVHLPDGRAWGMLCAAGGDPRHDLGELHLGVLGVLAEVVGERLDALERERRTARLVAANAGVAALLAAVEARDRYTAEHSRVVVELAGAVAERLGLEPEVVEEVRQVALLHDLGKLAVPDAILGKPAALDDGERRVLEGHPEAGARILETIPELSHLAPAVRAEHERWDGQGYPAGLSGDRIPAASRITLVCDAWHAMTSDRPYRRALGRERAARELRAGRGSQFCPRSTDALLEVLGLPFAQAVA
jgi:diguanylate cyclase (GGDEF)-like protein/putative nucleotidyltransferase with HDIG domain